MVDNNDKSRHVADMDIYSMYRGSPNVSPNLSDNHDKREPPMNVEDFARKVDNLAMILERQKLTDLGAAKLVELLGESNLTYEDVQAKIVQFLNGADPKSMPAGISVSVSKEEPEVGYSWKLQVSVQPGTPAYDLLARTENTRKLAAHLNVSTEWIQDLTLSDELLAALVKGKGEVTVDLGKCGQAIREQTEYWLAADQAADKSKISLGDLLSTTRENTPAITPPLTLLEKENLRSINLKDYFQNWPLNSLYYVRTPKDSEIIPANLPGQSELGGFKRGEFRNSAGEPTTSRQLRTYGNTLFQIQEFDQDPNAIVHVQQLKARTRSGEQKSFSIIKFDSAHKLAFDDAPKRPIKSPLGVCAKTRRHKTTLHERERLIAMGRMLGFSEEFIAPKAMGTTQVSLSHLVFVSARRTGKSRAMMEHMAAAILQVTMPRKYWAMTTKRTPFQAKLKVSRFRRNR